MAGDAWKGARVRCACNLVHAGSIETPMTKTEDVCTSFGRRAHIGRVKGVIPRL
jgi:hypothetical protein